MIRPLRSQIEGQRTAPESGAGPCDRPCGSRRGRLMPRPETTILLVAFAWTAGAKLAILDRPQPAYSILAWVDILLCDIVFFAALFLIISGLYICRPRPAVARCALLVAALTLAWSTTNAAWLIATGVQLQPGILLVLGRDPLEFWPIVQTHLMQNPEYAVPLGLTALLLIGWFLWRLVRPVPVVRSRGHHAGRAAGAALGLVAAGLGQWLWASPGPWGFESEALGFSSHWYALVSVATSASRHGDGNPQTRRLPRVGERRVVSPNTARAELPNVVLLLLESGSRAMTSLGNPELGTTPHLVRLAAEGVEFTLTRVPVSHTTKAFWAALTGTTPDIQPDYAEAVPVTPPYEGLPSILARCGYHSAFFQMSKGTFECAPGFFANLAFDWAWFRENLEDPSAHIGYLGGDDFRMLEPAFDWVAQGPRPFFLMMITCISHDPYEVPAWFAEPKKDRSGRYLQTVQYTDHFVGRLSEVLQERGLADTTILCVMGDHGTSLRTERAFGRWVPYEEVLRVPWVIRWPGHLEAGRRIDWPCSQLDLTPTLLELIGFDITEAGFEGKDAFTPSDPNRRLYFTSWFADSPFGFLEGSRKWVYWPYNDALFEYNLGDDPEERSPRVVKAPDKDRIVSELRQWQKKSRIVFDARRFRQRLLFDHWRTFSAGRSAWAYYVR